VKALRKQRVEYRCRDLRRLRIAADESDAIALRTCALVPETGASRKRISRATRAPSAAMRSGSQVLVQITLFPDAAVTSVRSTTSST
jgi:hypothetical protein